MTLFRIIALLLILLSDCFAQDKTKGNLYYFTNADSSKVGVKNERGEVVIPADYFNWGDFSYSEVIEDKIVEFYGLPAEATPLNKNRDRPASSNNTVYNGDGEFLYYPFWFDNGPDYIVEGLRRHVNLHTQKMGVVHPYGKVVIPANYDFVGIAHQGYFVAYNGVRKQYAKGGEHWSIARDSAATFECVLLNRDGEIVEAPFMSNANTSLLDQQQVSDAIAAQEIPAFYKAENTEEIALLQKLSQDTLAIRYKSEFRSYLEEPKKEWEIIERPTADFPYFVLMHGDNNSDYLAVDIHQQLYVFDYKRPMVALREYMASKK